MADARRVRAERQAPRVIQNAPVGCNHRCHSAGAEAAAITDQAVHEQQDSSAHPFVQPPLVQHEGRTTTASSSRARLG